MAQLQLTVAEIIGGPHDGALIEDVSKIELGASQCERWGVVYVLSILHDARLPYGQALHAYHPSAAKLL